MGKRQKRWARGKRVDLLLQLGMACAHCNATDELEFDCITPCGDGHHRLDTARRISFYLRQYREKNLQILCSKCNNKKSVIDKQTYPF